MTSQHAIRQQYVTEQDLQTLRTPSDLKAWQIFGFNWAVIAGCFYLISITESALVSLLALVVMAGRQLGIGILMYECAHRSFFKTRGLNDVMGHWFGGLPLLVPLHYYRPYHMTHHTRTGTEDDPDLSAIQQYPVGSASFKRKLLRDVCGLSGMKMLYGLVAHVLANRDGNTVSLGRNQREDQSATSLSAWHNFKDALLCHGIFLGIFALLGNPTLYLYWWLSFIFCYPFILRLRQIAEHGAMPYHHSNDPRDNTRTTLATWWERALFAPNFVNYHCEHHLLPTIPSYRLPQLHRLLTDNGFYQAKPEALAKGGYIEIMRKAASA